MSLYIHANATHAVVIYRNRKDVDASGVSIPGYDSLNVYIHLKASLILIYE